VEKIIFDSETAYDPAESSAIVSRITSLYDHEDWVKGIFGIHNITINNGDDFGFF
jgi:hypothetical protein